MSVSKEDILNAVAEMSVMDVVELVEAMEEETGLAIERTPRPQGNAKL